MSDVDLGRWTVDELRAAGFDEVGVVQPLLRSEALQDPEPVRRDLEARGALVLQDDGWTPRGDLGVVLVTRARARLVVSVLGRKTLLLGHFAPRGGLLQVDEDDGGCTCRLRTVDAVADDLLVGLLDGVPDRLDGAPQVPDGARVALALDALRAGAPDEPPAQLRLSVVTAPDGARLVRGHVGEQDALDVVVASHLGVRQAVREALAG